MFRGLGVSISEKLGNKPAYSMAIDLITMPNRGKYDGLEMFYSDLAHESIHSTGHHTRLARFPEGKEDMQAFADMSSREYALEELVAELGSAFLRAELQIDTLAAHQDSASYIAGWLSQLKAKPDMLIYAAQRAEKAANWVKGIRPKLEPKNEMEPLTSPEETEEKAKANAQALIQAAETPAIG